MTIGSVLLGLALFFLVALFLAQPFLTPARRQQGMTSRQALQTQKEVILDQIKELDFDHDTSKIPDEVYEAQRAQLLTEASEVLRKLDLAESRQAPAKTTNTAAVAAGGDDIEAAIARFRQASAGSEANGKAVFCTQCGKPLDAGDKFCAGCGQKVRAV